jgi:hypothetical protein
MENNQTPKNERWVHSLCYPLAIERNGPFINLPDSRLLTLDNNGLCTSQDDGQTWSEPHAVCQGIGWLSKAKRIEPASFYPLLTKNGVIVIVYLDFADYRWSWDEKQGEPGNDGKLEIWSIRSLDNGKTWVDRQKILGGYNANFFGLIQTRTGRLVTAVEHCVPDPGRWVACSLFSDDDGKSWCRSNFIDLGGHGHHDGATEPTVVELSDGRLLMLIRTNLDYFWQAFSDDTGRYWRTINRSKIDASSSPGYLLKLHSGRLVLVWNRLNPEGGVFPRKEAHTQFSETPASWHREELSIAFSEDDAKTWIKPVVIGRQKGGQLSYPFVFERRPGELWITAGFAFKKGWSDPLPFRVKIREKDFIGVTAGKPE